jgi:hypothetical protein
MKWQLLKKAQYRDGLYHSPAEIAIFSRGLGLSAIRLRKR